MPVGLPLKTTYANGDVFSASDINDTNGTINITAAPFAAGKNAIINGNFSVNQRNFTSTTTPTTFGHDRWRLRSAGGTATYSTQAFTAGTAPVAGYEGTNFARLVTSGQSTVNDYAAIEQPIEDVRTFAGQTVTVSFWAKASTGTPNIGLSLQQYFGSGGSATNYTSPAVKTITSSWARYSFNVTVPSVAGKTITTSTNLSLWLETSVGTSISAAGFAAVGIQNVTIDIWGVQVESGSTATAFQTATGTIQGELAACQRYYQVIATGNTKGVSTMAGYTSTSAYGIYTLRTEMRTAPTLSATSGTNYYNFIGNNAADAFDTIAADVASPTAVRLNVTSGIALTQGYAYWIETNNAASFVALQAEL